MKDTGKKKRKMQKKKEIFVRTFYEKSRKIQL